MKPNIKAETLECQSEPKPADNITTDVELAQWSEGVRVAGQDCRGKLNAVRKALQ